MKSIMNDAELILLVRTVFSEKPSKRHVNAILYRPSEEYKKKRGEKSDEQKN